MSNSSQRAAVPSNFQITETEFRCDGCGESFIFRSSPDNILVKFVDGANRSECWLPTFEMGGYLDVVEKCAPGFDRREEITMPIFREFEKNFQTFQNPPDSGGYWQVACDCICPKCNGKELEVLGEQIVSNPELKWMTYKPIP